MNDLDKNTGEGTKVPNAVYIPIKWRVITSGEMRLSHPLTISPFLPNISGGRICPGGTVPAMLHLHIGKPIWSPLPVESSLPVHQQPRQAYLQSALMTLNPSMASCLPCAGQLRLGGSRRVPSSVGSPPCPLATTPPLAAMPLKSRLFSS